MAITSRGSCYFLVLGFFYTIGPIKKIDYVAYGWHLDRSTYVDMEEFKISLDIFLNRMS